MSMGSKTKRRADYLATLLFLALFVAGVCWALAAGQATPAAISAALAMAVYYNLKKQRRRKARA
jgi:hypothetical protein